MSAPTYIETAVLEREIDDLITAYPELAEDDDLRADMLEGETELFSVLSRVIGQAQDAAGMADAIKARREALSARQDGCKRREEAMRKLALRLMERANLRKVTLPEATLSIRAVPPSVQITDETAIPEQWWRVKREIDKVALKAALKDGAAVPGAVLSNGSETLSVRV